MKQAVKWLQRKLSGSISGTRGESSSGAVVLQSPIVISRSDHNISRANISKNAIKVLYRLKNAG
ncbi:MAG: hypothetical protein QNJ78_16170, partial [Gammaproteobacteria bacterium]|nr:hypothetical protein [Gammaproteobacteria bacterium]